MKQLRAEVLRLEDQLKAANEKERLLVEYPDLHFVNNSDVSIAGLTIMHPFFLQHYDVRLQADVYLYSLINTPGTGQNAVPAILALAYRRTFMAGS